MLAGRVRFQDGHLYLMPVTLLFFLLGPAIGAVTIALHQDDPLFQVQNVIFLAFASAWLPFLLAGRVHLVSERDFGGWGRVALHVMVCTSAVLGVQIVVAWLSGPVTYVAQPVFIWLFYINAGISEEILFRAFTCTFIIIVIMGLPVPKKWRASMRVVAVVVAVAVSGIAFSLAHLGVYGQAPLMLLSTWIGGTIMAAFFVITRNPLVPVVAHVVNNAIAAGVIITSSILGVMV